jgi:hypothetical protein
VHSSRIYQGFKRVAFTIAEVFGLPIEAIFSRNGDPQ